MVDEVFATVRMPESLRRRRRLVQLHGEEAVNANETIDEILAERSYYFQLSKSMSILKSL